MGDNFKEIMTVEDAREVVRKPNSTQGEIQTAVIVLSLSWWFGDQMVAFEIRKSYFLKGTML